MSTPPGYPPPPGDPYGYPPPRPTSGSPYQTSGGPYQTSGSPYQTSGGPTSGGPYDPYAQPFTPPPGMSGRPPTRSRRGLLIGVLASVVLLLLAGGGAAAYLLLRGGGGDGQPDPTAAATNFLTAVYKDKDAARAEKYVCAAARDKDQIERKVNEVKAYAEKFNRDPEFSWDEPTVQEAGKEKATLAVTVRFATSDDRTSEQKLSITAIDDDGWYVCDVRSG